MKSKFFVWVVRIVGPIVRFIGNVHYHGLENEPDAGSGPYVMVCNHISNIDPLFLCAGKTRQQPHFMAKKELFKIPVLNKVLEALGAYPVDRGGADVSAIRKTIDMLNNGKCIGIFPQGHREKGIAPKDANLKNGAAMVTCKAQATVLPCCIVTKKNKFSLFRRTDVYFGRPISFAELEYNHDNPGEYSRVTGVMFDRVCELYRAATESDGE